MDWSEVLNVILGGGLAATIIGIVTLRSTIRKAKADAEKAKAEANTVNITNTEQATSILVKNIVEPLRQELDATRRDLGATKREMARLRKAIDDANSCKYSDNCPVLRRMQYQQKGPERNPDRSDPPKGGTHGDGQHKGGDRGASAGRDRSREQGYGDDSEGQPPAVARGRELDGPQRSSQRERAAQGCHRWQAGGDSRGGHV